MPQITILQSVYILFIINYYKKSLVLLIFVIFLLKNLVIVQVPYSFYIQIIYILIMKNFTFYMFFKILKLKHSHKNVSNFSKCIGFV